MPRTSTQSGAHESPNELCSVNPATQVVTAIIQRKSDGKLLLVKRSDQVYKAGAPAPAGRKQPSQHTGGCNLVSAALTLPCLPRCSFCRSAATSSTGAV